MAQQKQIDLTKGPVSGHLTRLTLPLMVGVLSAVAFNLIDTYFIGQLGDKELAAVSFTFPVIMVVSSLVSGIAIGATALISQSIGAGNKARATRETTDSLFLAIVIAIIFVIIGLNTIDPVFRLLGANEDMLPLIREYIEVWYITILVLIVPFIGNSALTAGGDTKTPSMIMLLAIVLNTILDPILIFGWGPIPAMGLRGAALATALARSVTLIASIYVLAYREQLITLKIPARSVVVSCWKEILFIGLPNGVSRMVAPLATGAVTALLASYGTEAVAAFGVSTRIEVFGISILMALSAAVAPFVGQNVAKKHWDRINSALTMSSWFSLAWGVVIALLFLIIARPVARWFTDDEEIINIVAIYLSIVPLSLGFQGAYTIVNSVLNTLKKPIQAFVISSIYTFLLYVPLAWAGSSLYGLKGIFWGIAVSNVLGALLAYGIFYRLLRKLSNNYQEHVKHTMPTYPVH